MAKILHVITRLDMGGSAQNTMQTCLGTSKKHEVVLVYGLSLESGMTDSESKSVNTKIERATKMGVKCICLPSLVRRIDPINDTRAFIDLINLFRSQKPDIVHTHTSKAGIIGRWAAKVAKIPHIIHTPHGSIVQGHFGPIKTKIFLFIEKMTNAITEKLIVLTEGEKFDYLSTSLAHPGQLVKIHSGVEVEKFVQPPEDLDNIKKSLSLDSAGPVIGTVGWLLPIKGPTYLLESMVSIWKEFPQAVLVYVGKGDLEESLKSQAATLGVSDKVRFLGWRNDIHKLMHVFDVFVLPSLNEGMGRVIVEAMAAAKPVVASNVGGIPDLVTEGETGYLVKPGHSQELAKAIIRIIENREKAAEMGKRGKNVCQNFSLQAMLDKLNALYEELLMDKDIRTTGRQ